MVLLMWLFVFLLITVFWIIMLIDSIQRPYTKDSGNLAFSNNLTGLDRCFNLLFYVLQKRKAVKLVMDNTLGAGYLVNLILSHLSPCPC